MIFVGCNNFLNNILLVNNFIWFFFFSIPSFSSHSYLRRNVYILNWFLHRLRSDSFNELNFMGSKENVCVWAELAIKQEPNWRNCKEQNQDFKWNDSQAQAQKRRVFLLRKKTFWHGSMQKISLKKVFFVSKFWDDIRVVVSGMHGKFQKSMQ